MLASRGARILALAIALGSAGGCGLGLDTSPPSPDAGSASQADGGTRQRDAGLTPRDASMDAPVRPGSDAAVDGSVGSGSDAATDGAVDSGSDAATDGSVDSGSDAATDGGMGPADAAVEGGDPCVTLCDDSNPCTDDTCGPGGGCIHTKNEAPCDDGIFCNGADQCKDDVCMHGGNPCSSHTTCDEAAGTCTGCATDSDCQPIGGAFGPCTFSDACTQSGTQQRTISAYVCDAGGVCQVSSTSTGSRACTRDTSHRFCGAVSDTGWSDCPADPCATGSKVRAISGPACKGGTCSDVLTVTELQTCPTIPEGMTCAPEDGCSPSACLPIACGMLSNGYLVRSCTDHLCMSGTCTARPVDVTGAFCTPSAVSTNGSRCYDGDPLTVGDVCVGTSCIGCLSEYHVPISCPGRKFPACTSPGLPRICSCVPLAA